MTLTDRQCAHTSRMGLLIVYANSAGLSVKVSEWNRLLSTQKEYVAKGVSKTLDSKHLENLATDIYIIIGGKAIFCDNDSPAEHKAAYRLLGVYWECRGGRWGGRFHDAAAWRKKYGREFDPSKDIGWDCYHMESA